MTTEGRIRRIKSGGHQIVDSARCPACGHLARIHNVVGCVSGPCECAVTRSELMPDAPRLEVPDGIESTPAVKATPPADSDGGHAAQGRPGQADASAAPPVVPVRPSSAWDPPKVAPLPPLPGAGVPRTPPIVAAPTPDADVERQADGIIAAGKAAARKRPRPSTARPAPACAPGSDAVVGELDAVEEVAVASTSAAAAGPLDLEPFLNGALTYYAAWACPTHPVQRRHDPGACDCGRALVPVYVVVHPRSTS